MLTKAANVKGIVFVQRKLQFWTTDETSAVLSFMFEDCSSCLQIDLHLYNSIVTTINIPIR